MPHVPYVAESACSDSATWVATSQPACRRAVGEVAARYRARCRIWQPPQQEAPAPHHPHLRMRAACINTATVHEARRHLSYSFHCRWVPPRPSVARRWGPSIMVPPGQPAWAICATVVIAWARQWQRVATHASEAVPASATNARGVVIAVAAARHVAHVLAIRGSTQVIPAPVSRGSPAISQRCVRLGALQILVCR